MGQGRRRNGEGTIYQRRDGKWVAQVTLHDGKRKSWVRKTDAEALEAMREGMRRDKERLPVADSKRWLSHWADEWREEIKAPVLRQQTANQYRQCLERLKPYIGGLPLHQITPNDIRRSYRQLSKEFAPASIRATHRVLSACLSDAVKDGLLIRNPAVLVTPPAASQAERPVLTVAEIKALIDVEADPQFKALWSLLGLSGLREGEAMALTWDRVALAEHAVQIQHTLVRQQGGGWEMGPPKTRSSRRTVQIAPSTAELLTTWRKDQINRKQTHRQHFVFVGGTHQPLVGATMRRELHQALAIADLPLMRVHDLRHSAATNMLASGMQINAVAKQLGHSSIVMTGDLYGHVTPTMIQSALDRLDSATG